jgi:hypothetical protein
LKIRCFYLLLLCCLLLPAGRAGAQQQAIQWDITAGFNGSFKAGSWFPVTVTISNSGPDLNATLSIAFRGSTTSYQQPIDLPSGANKRVVVPIFNRSDDLGSTRMDVTLRDGSRVVLSQLITPEVIGRGWNVVGIISEDTSALAELSTLEERDAVPTSLVRLGSNELPERVELLQSINALFVQGIDTSAWTEQQRAVLRSWLDSGGQLVVGGDTRTTRGLADLLPATVGGPGIPSNLQGLKARGLTLRDDARQVPLLQLSPQANAQVLTTGEAGQPLLLSRSYGSGRVIQTAFDLQALGDVGNPAPLWIRLLALNQQDLSLWEGLRNQGFSILRESLKLPQLGFLSAFGLFGFLSVYILVVGPVNYLLLRRFNRREWAYLTIPLWVLLFSAGAYAWGTLGRGGSTLVNQLAIVVVPQQAEQGRALAYVSLFSPSRTRYNLEFMSNALVSDALAAGGRANSNFDVRYAEGSVQVPELAVDVGGLSLLAVEQPVAAPKFSAVVREVNGRQEMTLRNLSDRRLTDLVLFRGDGQIQEVDLLAPGAERTIVLDPNHGFYDQIRISEGETVQRQSVVRQIGSILQPNAFGGDFGVPPVALPPGAYPQPQPLPDITPTSTPTSTPTPGGPTPDALTPLPTGTILPPTAAPASVDSQAPAAEPTVVPVPLQGAQLEPRQIWRVLAWEAQAPVEIKLDGSPAQARGETLYIWTAQKEQ